MTNGIDRFQIATFCVVLLGYLALLPIVVERLNPLTGDEPFYVMTAMSLIRDRSLDETDNYARRDYDEFYPVDPLPSEWNGWPSFPRTLPPHPAITEREGLFTKHGLGLSLLIAVPYELAGRVGAMVTVIIMASLVAANMYMLGVETGASRVTAFAVSTGLSLTLPIAPYALLIFPEVPAALLLIYAIRRVSTNVNMPWQWGIAGVSIGFLPWLHQRFALTSAALGLVLLYRAARTRDVGAIALGGLPIVAGALSIVSYNLWLYGSPIQNTSDHAGFSGASGSLNGLFGLLLDAQWGLLVVAPVYVWALSGVPSWFAARRDTLLVAAAAIVPYIAVVSSYRVWWGEWGPPARYLVPIAPIAAAPICCLITRFRIPGRVAIVATALPGIALTVIAVRDLQRMYHHPDGYNKLVGRLGELVGVELNSVLTVFQPYAQDSLSSRILAAAVLATIVTGITTALHVRRSARRAWHES